MILLQSIYLILFTWSIFRVVRFTKEDRKTLLYSTTKLLKTPCFSQARSTRKHSPSLSINRTVGKVASEANNKPVILYVFYHPLGSLSHDLELLNSPLLSNPESSCIVLVDDFNIPSIMWSDTSPSPVNSGGRANGEALCELIGA